MSIGIMELDFWVGSSLNFAGSLTKTLVFNQWVVDVAVVFLILI